MYVYARMREQMDGHSEREFPVSFRSLLDERGAAKGDGADANCCEAVLRLRCHCGECTFDVRVHGVDGQPPVAIRCHCSNCRRFHTSAFGAFVAVERQPTSGDWDIGGQTRRHRDSCAELGEVDRILCAHCFAKLATLPLEGARSTQVLLALGAVEDSSVPESLARRWQSTFDEWQVGHGAAWWAAEPTPRKGPPRSKEANGGCICGSCAFTAAIFPGEAQHCYCNLCRRLSGAASMTWIPCSNNAFRWTKRNGLRLVRTTRHGQRHICTQCGVVLTIVYDSQPDCTWPVAGALDDTTLPQDLSDSWYRVIHICCSMMQPWYKLPDDKLPRLKYAG